MKGLFFSDWITRGRTTLGAMNVMTEQFTALQPPLRPSRFIRAFKIVQPHCVASIKFIAEPKIKNPWIFRKKNLQLNNEIIRLFFFVQDI